MAGRFVYDFTPLGLTASRAAAYIGVSETKFREKVLAGEIPRPRKIDSCRVWDRREIENYFENLPRDGDDETDWGEDVAI